MTTATKYEPYPKYKPSDTDWLDQIPDRWYEKRLKNLISQKVTDGPHETPEFIADGVPFLSVDGIQDDRLIFDGCRYISPENHARYKMKCFPRRGDILLGKAASVGKVAIVDVDFEFNVWSPLALIRANKQVLPKYIYYSFKANTLQDQIFILSTSNTQHNLSMDDIPELWLTFPNIDEQLKIVSFLDRVIAKIDEVVAKKRKLIELLLEKRQAIISQVVTRGLNPKAKMKDSGIEWVGNLPENWELKKLKFIAKVNMGQSPSSEDCNTDGIGTPFLQGNGEFGDIHPVAKQFCENTNKIAKEHDILLSVRAPVGELNVADQSYGIGRGLSSITLNKGVVDQNYLWYSLMVLRIELASISTGSTYDAVSVDEVKDLTIIQPGMPEQKLIAEYIHKKVTKINELVEKIKLQNQKLQEFRQALISNVVTGKIKV